MKQGHIVDRGSPADLLDRYGRDDLEEVFLDIARDRPAERAADPPGGAADLGSDVPRISCSIGASWPRLLELVYWPTLTDVHLGLHRQLLRRPAGQRRRRSLSASCSAPAAAEIALRSQMGVAISFLEEIWSRNLGHALCQPPAPLGVAGPADRPVGRAHGDRRAAGGAAGLVAGCHNLFTLGPGLILFAINLVAMGWAVSLGLVSLIRATAPARRRWPGRAVRTHAVSRPSIYPVSVLPAWLRPLALALPSAHVFEGLRALVQHGGIALGPHGRARAGSTCCGWPPRG